MSSNDEKTDKYQQNLEMYNNTILQLVNGELNVLSANEREFINSLEMMERTKAAFQKTMGNAEHAITKVMGAERIWIPRGLNLILYICALENHPEITKYVNSEGFIELSRDRLFELDQTLVEAYLSIQSVLRLFLTEQDSPGKVVALKAMASSGHPVIFYGEGYVGPNGVSTGFYAKIGTKWGFIRAKKSN